jgi:hypothetical protein
MKSLTKLGVAFVAVLALGVAMVSTASAADPLFLFGTKTGFKVSGPEGHLKTLGGFLEITCKKTTGSGKTTGNDTDGFEGTVEYKECTSLGSEVKSLGAAAGTIVQKFKGELCWTNEKELKVGAYVEATEHVHVELPFGILDLIFGSQIGTITPVNAKTKTITLTLTGASGDPGVASCTGLSARTGSLKIIENENGTEKDGAIEAKLEMTPEEEGQIDG